MSRKDQPLTPKEELFLEYYLRSWNGADSARKAGYEPKQARFIAHQLLTKLYICNAIEERMKSLRMETNEWYARVTEQARGDIGDFIENDGSIDLKQARDDGKLRLLQEYQVTETYQRDQDNNPIPVTKTKVKLYSSQEALKMMGERLFVKKLQIEHIGEDNPYLEMSEEQLDNEAKRRESLRQKAITPARIPTTAKKGSAKKAKPSRPRKR